MNNINQLKINMKGLWPQFSFSGSEDEYILITSLNLGGAEKIVTDQLWANYWNKRPLSYTLIVLYDKEKEHPVPPNVNVVRLNGQLEQGRVLFNQIAFRNKTVVAHLVNDKVLEYLFSLNVRVNLVLHNDQQGWVNKPYIFNHENIGSMIAVCKYVERQIRQYTDKPIITLRHQIQYKNSLFDSEKRNNYQKEFSLDNEDKVIGMVGRIAWQKNYPKAIEILYHLVQQDPKWKLIIVGGYEPSQQSQYIYLCQLITHYKLQHNVILTGFRNDVKDLMNVFDIALNTSHFEGLSMATQELIGNGLTIFCCNVCGQEEILDQKKQIQFYSVSASAEKISQHILRFISGHSISRKVFTDEEIQEISKRSWASHRVWNLLHHSGQQELVNQWNDKKFAFLTSNFNLGGAQKSLVNLVKQMKEQDICAPVIVANQSNQWHLYNELIKSEIEVYLATDSIDAFDITNAILEYCKQNKINKILFWNVDAKLKLLLAKISADWLDIIDVSPGHYCFDEMESENLFIDGIYFDSKDYHTSIWKMVFKYMPDKINIPFYEVLENKTHFIPNGVFNKEEKQKILKTTSDASMELLIQQYKQINPQSYNFVVCGRIAPSKHLEVIFSAYENLLFDNKFNNKSKLYIIGSIELEYKEYWKYLQDKFHHLFAKDIIFLGQCDDAQHILSYFDCLIVLGTHQGCPNIVLEAFASDIAVIANDSGGTKEIVNTETGILLPMIPNQQALQEAMKWTLLNPEKMNKKAQAGSFLVNKNFSMKKMMESYLNVINDKKSS